MKQMELNGLLSHDSHIMLCNLVPFVEFKKREKHKGKSVTFGKAAGFSLQIYEKLHSSMGVFHVF